MTLESAYAIGPEGLAGEPFVPESVGNLEPGELIGRGEPIKQLRAAIRRVSRTDATVFVRGEVGVGKEFVARQVIKQGNRASRPIVMADLLDLEPELLEDYIFGPGTASGRGTPLLGGCFKRAEGGTLLLKEVQALPPSAQERLLQVLEKLQLTETDAEGECSPLPVRVIVTSSRPLETKMQRGEFRQDLLNALNIAPIQVPPLRERLEDIPLLAEHFRKRLVRKYEVNVAGFSLTCLETLQQRNWPGNARELAQAIESAILRCEGGLLEPEHFQFSSDTDAKSPAPGEARVIMPENLDEAHKILIFTVLQRCEGNRTVAAKHLGISIRTLRNKLREYRLQDAADEQQDGSPIQG